MPRFGSVSLDRLESCHIDLREIAVIAIELIDFKVISGSRNEDEQTLLYTQGFSKLRYPNSKHNIIPSMAFDIAPWPIDWRDQRRFYVLAGVILGIAHNKDIKVRWGGDWDMDWDFKDQTFHDLGHFELV